MTFLKTSSNAPRCQSVKAKAQRGQLVLEYVLLLAMVTTIGMLFITLLVGRGGVGPGGTRGLIVQQWMAIVDAVANDMPDN